MKKLTIVIFLIPPLFFWWAPNSISGETPTEKEIKNEVFNNVSGEYATCAAYFSIVSQEMRRNGNNGTAKKFEAARDISLNYAFIAAQEGRTDKMAKQFAIARTEAGMQSLMKEIGDDPGKVSILMSQYAANCKEILESPAETIEVWKDRIVKKYNLDKKR